jgi:hypothetical protein
MFIAAQKQAISMPGKSFSVLPIHHETGLLNSQSEISANHAIMLSWWTAEEMAIVGAAIC